jgi:serine/threonine protein phosphatase PrpC
MEKETEFEPKSLIAVATRSLKAVNQDACCAVENQSTDVRAVIIADGIGSDEGAENTSAEIVRHIARQIDDAALRSTAPSEDLRIMREMFLKARERLRQVREMGTVTNGDSGTTCLSGGSTALCVIEYRDRIVIAYCGNGAVLQIRADFNDFPNHSVLPWSTVDVLNPHSEYVKGKNLLCRFLSADATVEQATPSVLTISKDLCGPGDIFVACTDGISSRDQCLVGKNDMGIWTRTDAAVPLLYRYLDAFFQNGSMTPDALETTLRSYLEEFEALGAMEDDCTLGVLITSRAVTYQAERAKTLGRRVPDEDDRVAVIS